MRDFLEDQKAAYDNTAKKLLSRKAILAYILKYSVREFAECPLADIEKYIEGDPSLTINTVPLDDTLDIKGRTTASNSSDEGLVTFDIIFDIYAPTKGEPIKIIINIEPQKSTKSLNYQLMKRAVYYSARLISAQKEKEFHSDNYNGIKKIYSIWICMDVQNYRADSILEYRLSENVLHGDFHDAPANYDLIDIVILNLGQKPTTHKLLNLLHLLFMDLKSSAEKEAILKDNYNLKITRDMKGELMRMGGLMEPLLEMAKEKMAIELKKAITDEVTAKVTAKVTDEVTAKVTDETKKSSKLEDIRNLMDTMKLSAVQAMDALKISAAERREYLALI